MSGANQDYFARFKAVQHILDEPWEERPTRIWAYCPVHADGFKNGPNRGRQGQTYGRSFKIEKGRPPKCFAGCDITELMPALEKLEPVENRERFNPQFNGNGNGAKPPRPPANTQPIQKTTRSEYVEKQQQGEKLRYEVTAVYNYRDPETGDSIAHKCRQEAPNGQKQFRWRLPQNKGRKGDGWWGLKVNPPWEDKEATAVLTMEEMPLWRAYEIKDKPGRVWFVEGEKCVRALEEAGELAVCSPGSASTREVKPWVWEVLRGREVILWPDNDPVGRKYMEAIRPYIMEVAASVRVIVNAPVPFKGDVVDFLAAGGKLEDLDQEPTVAETTVLDSNHFIVRVPSPAGVVTFEFDEMRASGKNQLESDFTVSLGKAEPYNQWINLKSQSTREGLRRALEAQFGKKVVIPSDEEGPPEEVEVKWATLISVAYGRVKTAWDEVDRAISVADLPEYEEEQWLLDDFVAYGAPTLFFGDGSALKSYYSAGIALAVAMGWPEFCGIPVKQSGAVVIVDYEDPQSMRFRFRRLLLGMGFDPAEVIPNLPISFFPPNGEPLSAIVTSLKATCDERNAALVIVDSAMPACGGPPEDAVVALEFFRALSKVGRSSIVISHASKGELEAGLFKSYGGVSWHNMPRRTYAFMKSDDRDSDEIDISILCRKANNGRKPPPAYYRATFVPKGGPVTWQAMSEEQSQVSLHEDERPLWERAADVLAERGELAVAAIAKELGMEGVTAKKSLRKAIERAEGAGAFTKVLEGSTWKYGLA